MAVEVKVYDQDNDTLVVNLTTARQVRSVEGKVQLEDDGDGILQVDHDHPNVSAFTEGRWVQVADGARTPITFRVDSRRDVRIPNGGGEAAKIVEVKGAGPRSILKLGRVLPWMAVGTVPLSRRRRFDWSSPGLDTTDWTTPFEQARLTSEPGKPFGLPALFNTRWLWGEAEAETMTIGSCVFRRQFTLADDAVVSFFTTADDRFSTHLQSVELQSIQSTFPAKTWHTPYRDPVSLTADTYVFGIHATNDGGKGAIICDAWTTTEDGLIDQVFMSGLPGDPGPEFDFLYGEGDEAWICFMDPAGEWWTPGEIMRILLEECHARDELLDVSLDFTDTLDSAGNAWPKIEAEFDATGTYHDAMGVLEASWIDYSVSLDGGLVISAWNKDPGKGTTTSVTVTAADKEVQSDATVTDFAIANDVLLQHDRGLYLYESPLSILAYGRRPGGTLPVGSISDEAILDQIGAAHLAGRTTPALSRVVEVVPTFALAAEVGDTITVEGDPLRVVEIGFEFENGGELAKVPVLSTPNELERKRGARVAARLIAEKGESRAAATIIDRGTLIESGPINPTELESWSWTAPEDLDPEWWDNLEENPRAWQPHTVRKRCRLVAIIVRCEWAEPDGVGDITPVAIGDTSFRLIVNRQPLWNGIPFVATVPEINPEDSSDPEVYAIQYVEGEALLNPLDVVSVAPELNGEHVNGSVQLIAVDAS